MAYIVDQHCDRCREVTSHTNGACDGCEDRYKKQEEQDHLDDWKKKSTDEKLLDIYKLLRQIARKTNFLK